MIAIAGVALTEDRLNSFCKQFNQDYNVALTLMHAASEQRQHYSSDKFVITTFVTEATETAEQVMATSAKLYSMLEFIKVNMTGEKENQRFIKTGKNAKELFIEILEPIRTTPEQRLVLNAITEFCR
jgi:hypothetical protein